MRDRFVELFENMNNVNIAESPTFIFTKKLMLALMEKQLPPAMVGKIVGKMEINVGQAFIQDTELVEKSLETYTKLIISLYEEFKAINGELAEAYMENLQGLSLKADW